MLNKLFSDRLNLELDEIGVPVPKKERIDALAKLIRVPHFKAEALLEGKMLDPEAVEDLSTELEVSPDWLTGKSDSRE